jgi:hypothetical protein
MGAKFDRPYIAGTTILGKNPAGLIESICFYHAPYRQTLAFSAELARHLTGDRG